ncbi:hypothetical protein BDA99DRAFT_438545 [Phascolomyces articulosus]|uniref:Sulfotransferase family protein n=1 Tax=Phascolomyces articulosus TaxID=60185 RepID=A0AAD5KA29_9FUNG|nr:hypothetical protein BDA99DRAFT_438545 [Phascolomyces articulosus]
MTPLKVIGVGVSRSGTNSSKFALETLGYKTHHIREMIENDLHPERVIDAYKNPEKSVDWNELYGDFNNGVEFPTFCFVDRLIEYFPDAKVILTKRNPDVWYKSVINTICKLRNEITSDNYQEYAVLNRELIKMICLNGLASEGEAIYDQLEVVKARYKAHNKYIMETVPAERLLVLDLRDGMIWDKLCTFLDKPIPLEPFQFLSLYSNSSPKILVRFFSST